MGGPIVSTFLTPLDGRWLDDEHFMLLSPLKYASVLFGDVITVEAGFVTDFASVPRAPIIYSLFGDRAHHESVPHDFLYQTHLKGCPKPLADKIFKEAMIARNKPWGIYEPMYLGVVLGGGTPYKTGPERFTVLQNWPGKIVQESA